MCVSHFVTYLAFILPYYQISHFMHASAPLPTIKTLVCAWYYGRGFDSVYEGTLSSGTKIILNHLNIMFSGSLQMEGLRENHFVIKEMDNPIFQLNKFVCVNKITIFFWIIRLVCYQLTNLFFLNCQQEQENLAYKRSSSAPSFGIRKRGKIESHREKEKNTIYFFLLLWGIP